MQKNRFGYLKKTIFIFLAALVYLGSAALVFSQEPEVKPAKLIMFYSPACKTCSQIKAQVIPQIQEEFKGRMVVEYRDISDIENYKLLLALEKAQGLKLRNVVPIFYLEGRFLDYGAGSKEILSAFIDYALKNPLVLKSALPAVDLLGYFKSFTAPAIITAGLIDGINPCAFTVMVFFISFLAFQGYRRRQLVAVGLSFLFSVFLTYIVIGLGLMGFLYRLEGFWLFAKIINIGIGAFSIILGVLALYDVYLFLRRKTTEGLILQLPTIIKNKIHSIVGQYYRQQTGAGIFSLSLSAFVVGFLISILEAVCTGQVYLPTITFVLKASPLKLQALGWLLLYNIIFVVPLFIIFILSLLGTTSLDFAKFLKRHLLLIKVMMAAIFFSFGIVLLDAYLPLRRFVPESKPEAQSQAQAKDYLWDFGRVKEGEVLQHEFMLKNNTQSILKIKEVNTSCGCTVSQIKKKVLLAGEETVLEVKFDTKGYVGLTKQYVYVHTDNPREPIIRFIVQAEVVK